MRYYKVPLNIARSYASIKQKISHYFNGDIAVLSSKAMYSFN